MPICSTKHATQLESPYVLAPERYDPRRTALNTAATLPLREIALPVRKTVNSASSHLPDSLVLDTSDAHEGIITRRKPPVPHSEIGSAKKRVEPHDVIISRLRPYLRQVALVDTGIRHWRDGVPILCSTEFYVLRSVDKLSIAFLVPFLLSPAVQRVLAASQEGGHHPRFSETTLLDLPVPKALLQRRADVSRAVEAAVKLYRDYESGMMGAIQVGSIGLD